MPITESPIFLFLITATSQLAHYTPTGDRKAHPHVIYRAGEHGFEKDSVLDTRLNFYSIITQEAFLKCAGDMEVKGQLPKDKLNRLFPILCDSGRIPKKVLRDVRISFQNAGVTGLSRI